MGECRSHQVQKRVSGTPAILRRTANSDWGDLSSTESTPRPVDLPGFFGPMISRKMAPNPRGAHGLQGIAGKSLREIQGLELKPIEIESTTTRTQTNI